MDAARQAELEAEQVLMRKYGGLPKANPIFAHSLKSQKHYFDSGDWQLQQQGGLGTAGAHRPLASSGRSTHRVPPAALPCPMRPSPLSSRSLAPSAPVVLWTLRPA